MKYEVTVALILLCLVAVSSFLNIGGQQPLLLADNSGDDGKILAIPFKGDVIILKNKSWIKMSIYNGTVYDCYIHQNSLYVAGEHSQKPVLIVINLSNLKELEAFAGSYSGKLFSIVSISNDKIIAIGFLKNGSNYCGLVVKFKASDNLISSKAYCSRYEGLSIPLYFRSAVVLNSSLYILGGSFWRNAYYPSLLINRTSRLIAYITPYPLLQSFVVKDLVLNHTLEVIMIMEKALYIGKITRSELSISKVLENVRDVRSVRHENPWILEIHYINGSTGVMNSKGIYCTLKPPKSIELLAVNANLYGYLNGKLINVSFDKCFKLHSVKTLELKSIDLNVTPIKVRLLTVKVPITLAPAKLHTYNSTSASAFKTMSYWKNQTTTEVKGRYFTTVKPRWLKRFSIATGIAGGLLVVLSYVLWKSKEKQQYKIE